MIPFELAEPRSFAEAVALLDPEDPTVRPIAGGTALMLMMKAGLFQPTRLISLRRVEPELSCLETLPDGGVRIGALTPLSTLERTPALQRALPVVAHALRTLSNVRVRNVATIGGHLAHGDPHMDLPPLLIALDAAVTIAGPAGRRTIPIESLFAGYFETTVGRDELIETLTVPAQAGRPAAYLKLTTRSADDWPAVGVAVVLTRDGDRIGEARVAVGAATETARRLPAVEAILRGAAVDDDVLRRAGEAAANDLPVLTDAQGSAAYKRQLVRVAIGRAVRSALANGPSR